MSDPGDPIDEYLELFDGNGQPLAAQFGRITIQISSLGPYTLLARDHGHRYTGNYVLSFLAPCPPDLVASYFFDSDALDFSGNQHDGVISNATFTSAVCSNGLSFSGRDSFVEVADSHLLNLSSGLTIAMWVQVRSFPNAFSALIYKAGKEPTASGFQDRSYTLWVTSSGGFHFTSTPQGADSQIACNTDASLVATGEWFHVAATVDALSHQMRVYLNGRQVTACDYPADVIGGGPFPLRIGGPFLTLGDQAGLDGILDEVRIYDRALSDSEIAALPRDASIRFTRLERLPDQRSSLPFPARPANALLSRPPVLCQQAIG